MPPKGADVKKADRWRLLDFQIGEHELQSHADEGVHLRHQATVFMASGLVLPLGMLTVFCTNALSHAVFVGQTRLTPALWHTRHRKGYLNRARGSGFERWREGERGARRLLALVVEECGSHRSRLQYEFPLLVDDRAGRNCDARAFCEF